MTEAKDHEPLESQVNRLAEFIMAEVPGEPSQSEGAIDTAIRIIASLRDANKALTAENDDLHDLYASQCKFTRKAIKRATAAEAKLAKVETFAAEWHCICQVIATILELPEPDADFAAIVRDKFDRLSAELAEARVEIERLTPLAVAYDYLESPAGREMAEDKLAEALKLLLLAKNVLQGEAAGRTWYEQTAEVLEAVDAFLASKENHHGE